MFTKDELLVIKDAFKIADKEYIKQIDLNKNSRTGLVAYNRKQKKLWMAQNKLNKILDEKLYEEE
ncbi:MAG: hypothetical protein RR891_07980 [Clostridium sp.]|uniref:hypothetical protein n=1 Tax=Clostridium sp. TaxID=1506 RepID=UPI00306DF945